MLGIVFLLELLAILLNVGSVALTLRARSRYDSRKLANEHQQAMFKLGMQDAQQLHQQQMELTRLQAEVSSPDAERLVALEVGKAEAVAREAEARLKNSELLRDMSRSNRYIGNSYS